MVVTEDSITQCVRDIRRALNDTEQRLIRTLPRRGYMLTVPVTTALPDRPLDDGEVSGRSDCARPSIAVLPFMNMSADPNQEYFSDGIADDIITELSRSPLLYSELLRRSPRDPRNGHVVCGIGIA